MSGWVTAKEKEKLELALTPFASKFMLHDATFIKKQYGLHYLKKALKEVAGLQSGSENLQERCKGYLQGHAALLNKKPGAKAKAV